FRLSARRSFNKNIDMKTRIGVIFGGRSGEHEVSVRSARAVIEQIDKNKYSVIPIAIDHRGSWLDPSTSASLLPIETAELIKQDVDEIKADSIAFIGDPKHRGLANLGRASGSETVHRIDVAFPVLHGTF